MTWFCELQYLVKKDAKAYFGEDAITVSKSRARPGTSSVRRQTKHQLHVPQHVTGQFTQNSTAHPAKKSTDQAAAAHSFLGTTPLHIAAEGANESLMIFLLNLFSITEDSQSLYLHFYTHLLLSEDRKAYEMTYLSLSSYGISRQSYNCCNARLHPVLSE